MNRDNDLDAAMLFGDYQYAMNGKDYKRALELNDQIYAQVFDAYLKTKDKDKKEVHKTILNKLYFDVIDLTHNKINTREAK